MKNTARKIFAILLAMMMAFDVIPFCAAAEGNGTDKDTGEYGGTFRDVLKNNYCIILYISKSLPEFG